MNEKEWKVPAPPKIKLLKTWCSTENIRFEMKILVENIRLKYRNKKCAISA
jgi:hypothetical protein